MSTIIKASEPRAVESVRGVQRIAFNFDDMTQQANKYLHEVRAQAAQIIKDAQEQAKAVRKQAEQQGHQAALQAVERVMDDKVGKHMKTLMPAVEQAVGEIQRSRQAWLGHWQEAAVKLSCAIAARVIRRELAQTPEITLDLITEALQLAAGSAEIAVHLNPTDLENLGGQVEELTRKLNPLAPATIVGDPQITPGGCQVQTRFGAIDQQIEAQLARIEEELNL